MPYRFEHASTGRAGCKGTACKKEGTKILKGELRCGSYFQLPEADHGSWSWKHWGCVTPKQIENINNEIEGDTKLLDGLEELSPDEQEKIITALADGHVADEDWRDDPEMNRLGATRKRKAKPKADAEDGDDAAEKKPPAKKPRGKAAKSKRPADDSDEEEAAAPEPVTESKPKKKRKSARDAAAAAQADDAEAGAEEVAAPAKKRGQKATALATTADHSDGATAPTKKRGKKAADPEPAQVDGSDDAPPKKTKAKASRKKAAAKASESDEESEAEVMPQKKVRGRRAA